MPTVGPLVTSLSVALAIAGGLLAVFGVYLVVLVVAALFYRSGSLGEDHAAHHSRIAVLIPAHDEAAFIARCVASLRAQTYPAELREIVVIADNCSDDTAAVAASAGAEVLVRDEPASRGKGRALQWALDRLLIRSPPPDAVVIVDADSVAQVDFLSELVRRFEAGSDAVQGESLLTEDESTEGALRAAAFLLVNRARPMGRAVLHLPSGLSGNGMLFGRDVLVRHPWSAFTSAEDVEYHVKLRLAGVEVAFAQGAVLRSPPAPHARAAEQQQLRWEGGKLHLVRSQIPRLVGRALRERRPSLLDTALELAVPPLGFLAAGAFLLSAVGALLYATGLLSAWALITPLVALASIPVYVLVGFRAAEAPRSAYRSLVRAPGFVVSKTLRAYRLLRFRADSWVRTERPRD